MLVGVSGQRSEAAAAGDAFRERIVQASVELIAEQGLGALSMREVARRAGVSHQAPYYYFQDREAILGAIAEQGFRMLREAVTEATAAATPASSSLYAGILAAGEAYIRFAFAHPPHFRVMFRPELVAPERHPNMKAEGDRACAVFFEIVREAVQAGLPADPSLDALFLTYWSLGHGFACLALDGPLEVVTPGADREAQLRDVLQTMAKLMEASVSQAAGAQRRTAAKSSSSAKPKRPARKKAEPRKRA
jgi:AcrR family transcriptional regulator